MFSHATNQDGDMKMRQQSPEAEGRAWHHGPSLVVDVGVGEVEVALLVEVEFVGEVEGHALGRPPSAVRIGDAGAVAVADGGRGRSVGDSGAATRGRHSGGVAGGADRRPRGRRSGCCVPWTGTGSGGAVARIGGGGADEDAGGKRDGIVEEGSATRSRGIERASRAVMTAT